jgi:hypothetical protein
MRNKEDSIPARNESFCETHFGADIILKLARNPLLKPNIKLAAI